jgi:hypothetical protein
MNECVTILINQHPQLWEFVLEHEESFNKFFEVHNNAKNLFLKEFIFLSLKTPNIETVFAATCCEDIKKSIEAKNQS